MRRLALIDAFFLMNETRQTPMHVGGVNLFTLPEGADEQEFLSHLGNILRHEGPLRRPFGERLKMGPLGVAGCPTAPCNSHILHLSVVNRH